MVRQARRQPRQPRNNGRRNRPDWEPPEQPDEPIDGLVPVGSGFYATSGDPVSPFDCTRWPDSPFCGGNPFTRQPIGFNFSKVQDGCNIGIQIAPVFGFVKLPISQLVYRFPGECRLPPPPEPLPINSSPACSLLKIQGSLSENSLAIAYRDSYFEYRELAPPHWEIATNNTDIVSVKFNDRGYFAIVTFAVTWSYKSTLQDIDEQGSNYVEYGVLTTYPIFTLHRLDEDANKPNVLSKAALGIEFSNLLIQQVQNNLDWIMCMEDYDPAYWSIYDFTLPQPGNPPDIEYSTPIRSFSVSPNPPQGTFYGIQWSYEWESLWIINKQSTLKTFITNFEKVPPPPPDDKDCKCMCCDDSLLRLLLSRVNKIYQTVGVDDYPVSAPQWITKDDEAQISIANITRFISYTVKQLDSISGNYPIKIKIQDADLTQEGNQEKTVTLPNAAEALAEIVGMLLAIRSETNATLIASVNGMIEAGSSKQTAFLAYEYAKANAEFLAYKGKQVERDMPFTFKPNEPQLDEMMKPSTVKVKGFENDDKDDFTDAIAPLLELAAMWKGQNFRNLGASDPIQKLRTILKGANEISGAMNEFRKNPPHVIDPENPDAPPPEPQKDEWDAFVEEAEQGFIAKPGITDNINPYSRPLEQRPRIREIGDDTSDTES